DDMTLLLGNGNGTFQAPVSTVTDSIAGFANLNADGLVSIQNADFNGDGHPDLVVMNNSEESHCRFDPGAVLIFSSIGGLAMVLRWWQRPWHQQPAPRRPRQVRLRVEQLDERIVPALTAAQTFPGGFTPNGIGFGPNAVAVGDFNGDGKPDVVAANGRSGIS